MPSRRRRTGIRSARRSRPRWRPLPRRWALVVAQLLEDVHVGLVRALAVQTGYFQKEGCVGEAPVMQDAPEPLDADRAVADVLVAVPAGAQLHLRVVGVHRHQVLEPHFLLELRHRDLEALGGTQVVARGVRVLRVQADLDTVRAYFTDDPPQVREAGADGSSGAGRVLKNEQRVLGRVLDDIAAGATDLREH